VGLYKSIITLRITGIASTCHTEKKLLERTYRDSLDTSTLQGSMSKLDIDEIFVVYLIRCTRKGEKLTEVLAVVVAYAGLEAVR
jgi:hypothetical protein